MAKVTLTAKSNAMKSYLPLLTFAILLTSCSSVYQSGQTPDDVYYSPERPQDEYVRTEKRNDRMYRNDDVALEDRYLRMKVRNRRYVFLDDDYDYYYGNNYNRYHDYYRMNISLYGYCNPWTGNYGYNRYHYNYNPYNYNPYYYNPYYGNPYYSGVVYGNVSPVYNKPRTTNLHVFDRNNSRSPYLPKSNGKTYNTYSGNEDNNYRGSGNNAGGFLRDVFGSGQSNRSNTNSSNTSSSSSSNSSRSSSSSSSSNSSSGSSSGSSHAPVRKF